MLLSLLVSLHSPDCIRLREADFQLMEPPFIVLALLIGESLVLFAFGVASRGTPGQSRLQG